MATITIIGSSTGWTPTLATDLMSVFDEPLEFRLFDIDPAAAELCARWGEAFKHHFDHRHRFVPFSDRREALRGADAVIITISTGGLRAMAWDLQIPERFGVFATVGDTSGPGGWSRAIRNIPVLRGIAEDAAACCPTAIIANYTNPMAAVTATLQRCCPNPVVGLCHAYFETKDVIQKVFGLPDWRALALSIAGMNHFTWVTSFRIGAEDGYELLRRRLGAQSIRTLLPQESADEINIYSGHALCAELYDAYGYLPYPADRHISEFLPYVLTGNPERYLMDSRRKTGERYDTIRSFDVKRTTIEDRQRMLSGRAEDLERLVRAEAARGDGLGSRPRRSRETGAEMIRAYLGNRPFVDAVNCLNAGQVPGLPPGACVETLGVVDGMGVRPLLVPDVPGAVLELIRPIALCQDWLVEAVLGGDRKLAVQALRHDPQCAHLKPAEVSRLADELLAANKEYVSL